MLSLLYFFSNFFGDKTRLRPLHIRIFYCSVEYKDVPKSERNIFQESDEKIMHATLPLSKETMLNGSDNSLAYNEMIKYKTFSLIIHADSKEEEED